MKKKLRRLITLLLAITLTVGLTAELTAGANGETMDMDGDGRITIHDVQLAREIDNGKRTASGKQSSVLSIYSISEIFNRIFGITYTPTLSSGVYQIDSIKGLNFVRENASEGYSYKLTQNIDLGGAEWIPIDDFTGTFDGNSKTISNFVVTKGAVGSKNKNVIDQGFFSEILAGATVKNLNLSNAQVVATEERAQFIGLLCGTNRGTITGCYTHGKITDLRETAIQSEGEGDYSILAAIVARNLGDGSYTTVTNKNATEPTYNNGTYYTLQTADTDVNDARIPIAAQLAVEVADRDDIKICLSFNAPKSGTTQFQDISATWGVSETLQDKQDRAVQYMVDMGQLAWSTPVDLVWKQGSGMEVDGNVETDTWKANTTHYGIPFNGYHNGLERTQSVMNYNEETGVWEFDANLAYEVQTGQTSAAAWYTSANWSEGDTDEDGNTVQSTDVGYDGWIRYMGNDCSSAVSWAWLQISPVDAYVSTNGKYDGGGVFLDTCRHSFPYTELDTNCNSHYGHQHGLIQIGYYDFYETDDKTGEITQTFLDASTASTTDSDGNGVVSAKLDGKYATTSANIWEWNADNTKTAENEKYAKLYETYAQARKGDVLQSWFTGDHYQNTFSEDTNNNGVLDTYHEDLNANGKLDEGEDANGNGKLDVTEDVNQNGKLDTALTDRVWEGHVRMLAEDPVAIRNYNGTFDLKKSYFITCEHGGAVSARRSTRNAGKTDGTKNSWGLWQKYTFADLDYTSGSDCKNANDSSRCYLPITCRALREDSVKAQTYSFTSNPANGSFVKATAPYAGTVYTNYALATATMYVYSLDNQLAIDPVTISALPEGGVRSTQTQYRWSNHRQKQLSLTEQFAFVKDRMDEAGLENGEYKFQLKLESVLDVYNEDTGKWENSSIMTETMQFTYTQ